MVLVSEQTKNFKRPKGLGIEDGVWIGANAMALNGITVCRGATAVAGVVVIRFVLPFHIVAGKGTKTVRFSFPERVLVNHIDLTGRAMEMHWS